VAKGLVEEAKLTSLIKLKSEESILDCFLWPDGEFAFEDGHVPEKMYLSTALDVAGLIRESEIRAKKWTNICALFPSSRTTFAVTDAADAAKDLSEEHRRVAALAERGMSLAEIALELHAMEFRVASCLLDLYERKLIRTAEISQGRSYEDSVEELRTLLREGLTYFNAGDHTRALPAFQAALEIDPQSKAYLYIKKIEKVLEKGESRVSLPLEAVPVLAIPVAELASKTLTHQEGFVLSRVNGDWNIGSILKICPMSEDEVGAIFRRLQGSGIIAIEEQSDSRGVVPINDAAPETPIRR
jgi:tetratricopeptide (TPR) repeat protein